VKQGKKSLKRQIKDQGKYEANGRSISFTVKFGTKTELRVCPACKHNNFKVSSDAPGPVQCEKCKRIYGNIDKLKVIERRGGK